MRVAEFGFRRGRGEVAYVGLLVALAFALWIPRLSGPIDLRYDAGVYYILGTSIAQGEGYRLLNEPGAIQAIQYPPMQAVFVAAHQWATGTSDPVVVGQWLRVSFAVLFLAYVVLVYLVARWYLAPPYAFFAGLVSILHVNATWHSDLLQAELPYGVVTMLFFIAAQRSSACSVCRWVAGPLAAIAFLWRSAGVVLLAAWVGESLLLRRPRQMLVRILIAAVPFVGWQAYIAHVKGGTEYAAPAYEYQRAPYQFYNVGYAENIVYIDPFIPELGKMSAHDLVLRMAGNLVRMPLSLGEAVSSGANWTLSQIETMRAAGSPLTPPAWIAYLPQVILGAGILVGVVLLALRREWLVSLYLAGSIVLIATTPWRGEFGRYLAPLTPLLAVALIVALLEGQRRLARVAGGRWRGAAKTLVPAVAAAVLVLQVVPLARIYSSKHRRTARYVDSRGAAREQPLFFYTEGWTAQASALDWLRRRTGRDDGMVATSTPHWAYLRTGRSAIMIPFERDPGEVQRLLDGVPVEYLVLDRIEHPDVARRYGGPVIERFPERWRLVYATPDSLSQIYRRIPAGPGNTELR